MSLSDMRADGRLLKGYVYVLGALAVPALTYTYGRFGLQSSRGRWTELALLTLILALCEMRPISVVRDEGVDDIVASSTFAFALFLSFGPLVAILAQGLSSILADLRLRKAGIKIVFNVIQYTASWCVAAFMFGAIHAGSTSTPKVAILGWWGVAVAVAALTYFTLNNILVGVALALFADDPILPTVRETIRSEWTSDIVLLALAPIVVIVAGQSLPALPLLLLPIVAVYRGASLSAEKQHLALHDSLTDLPNRFQCTAMLTKALEHAAKRPMIKGAVLLIDLDHFKEINDTLGHQAGDGLLQLVGPRIQEVLREDGTVSRLGGDEFCVLLPNIPDEPTAIAVAHRVAAVLEAPFRLEGFNIDVGASIGVAVFPTDGSDHDALMKRADIAMYVAKTRGTVVERYDPSLDYNSTRRLELMGELRNAITEGSVQLYYQPKLDLRTGQVREVESLVRWVHPRLGLVTPSEFVALAEHTGLIRPLTSHVLRTAVAQAARWLADGTPLTVAVNLSARSLHDGAILREISTVLEESNLPPSLLRLEITESSIMADPHRAKRVLEQLDDMGIRLSIDDFGTGYSSLAYLKDLPVNEIKIDRSFVANVLHQADDQVIVRSIIDLARNLNLTCVAEGVESDLALQWVRHAGCNLAQGFHVARPMTAGALKEWVASRLHSSSRDDWPSGVIPLNPPVFAAPVPAQFASATP